MAMTETSETKIAEASGKTSKRGLVLALMLSVLGAAGGFFAVSTDLLSLAAPRSTSEDAHSAPTALPDVAFIEIPSLIITLPPGAQNTHLRFSGQIEVPAEHRDDVEFLMPRIQDVLNGYLRALSVEDIEGPGALFKIRLQLFRRIVMVVGLGKVDSLLVTEFILN
jgi:flagellar FliL protein